jgi:uncharacterized protein YggT (Ycf19 family)
MAFSALSFFLFLSRFWGVSLVFACTRGREEASRHTVETIYTLSRPFSDIRIELRPLVYLAAGMFIAALLEATGSPTGPNPIMIPAVIDWQNVSPVANVLKLLILALGGWVQILPVIQQLMLLLIIGSWVAMFTGSYGMSQFCREWIDLFLGPLRRYPVRIGMLDISPIIFFFVIGIVHSLLMAVLLMSHSALA